MPQTEEEFRIRLASLVESWGHYVAFHEGEHRHKFSVHYPPNHGGTKGFVDLYVRTTPAWRHARDFPVIGVETKIPDIGVLIRGMSQVSRYRADQAARYEINGRTVPAPTIYLVATPESVEEGEVYAWQAPAEVIPLAVHQAPLVHEAANRASRSTITFLYNRLLWRHGAAILQGRRFRTNMKNPGAPWYDLAE
jgi:hypothetical protein